MEASWLIFESAGTVFKGSSVGSRGVSEFDAIFAISISKNICS